MKSSNELLKQMQPGDYVLVKTLGQLIDTGVADVYDVSWMEDGKVKDVLGKMLPIDYVLVIDNIPHAIFSFNDKQYMFGEEMFFQLYPLTRGLI